MKKFANTVRSHKGRLFRFACSSAGVLGVKIGLLWLLEHYSSPRVAYALTHVGVFLVSYLLHGVVTFKQKLGLRGMFAFLKAVAVIKILDYALFFVLITHVPESLLLATLVTGVMFVGRYFILRASFRKQRARSEMKQV